MGNCRGDSYNHIDVTFFPVLQIQPNPMLMKSQAQTIRFGEVQKFKSASSISISSYNFILPIKQSFQMIKVQCPIISNYSDNLSLKIPILSGIETVRIDNRNAPIIDLHDISDNQILHKFVVRNSGNSEQHYSVKVYPFNNYHDISLKAGLYQAYLYNQLGLFNKNRNTLKQLFIIEKGIPNALVFVFSSFMYTLEDVLIYRNLANMPYQTQEQYYIIAQILNNYKSLYLNNVVHRDIRPGKIYLAESSRTDNPYVGSSAFQGYEFQNLQSARKITQMELLAKQNGKSQIPMTARGVPLNCSKEVAAIHERGQQMGLYDPWINDRIALAKTVAAILTLDVQQKQINYNLISEKNSKIGGLINDLQKTNTSFFQILRRFQTLNWQVVKASSGVVQSDYNICMNYLPKLLKGAHAQRIQITTTQTLFLMHMRDLFSNKLDKMLQQNYRSKTPYENVAILNRLGRYYQGIGVSQNDYYAQQIDLLLQMAQQQRLRGFLNDQFIAEANQISNDKFNGNLNHSSSSMLKVENAYNFLEKNNIQFALQNINKALLQGGSSSTIPIDKQIKIIKAKGIIQTVANGPDAGDIYLQKGLDLSKNRNNFFTQIEMIQSKSDFQYLLGKNILSRIYNNRNSMPPQLIYKQLAKCESLFLAAKQAKTQVPLKNTLPLAHIYEIFGDLSLLRQDYNGVSTNYQKCYRLIESSELTISDTQKLRILQKMYNYYMNHSQNFVQQQNIKMEIKNIKKKYEKGQIRDNRKQFERIRYLKKQSNQQDIIGSNSSNIKQNIIPQVQQMYQEQKSKRLTQSRG